MHPKNSTTLQAVQLPKLKPCAFGMEYTDLFSINPDANLIDALSVASDLSDGISQLCTRLAHSINDGEPAYLSEVRTLGFIGDVVSALTRSAERGLKAVYQAEEAQ